MNKQTNNTTHSTFEYREIKNGTDGFNSVRVHIKGTQKTQEEAIIDSELQKEQEELQGRGAHTKALEQLEQMRLDEERAR